MSLATGVTMMGRRQAEALMESTCVITRNNGLVTDQNTGVDSDDLETIYTGKCRLRMQTSAPRQVVAAGQQVALQSPILSLPIDGSESVRTGDVAVITSPLDPATVTVRIAGTHSQTHSTARRFP